MKKFLFTSLFLFVCAAIIWGGFSHILVNEKLYENDWTHFLSIVFIVLSLYMLYKPNSVMRQKLEQKNKNIFLTAIAFSLAIFLFTKLFFERGIPVVVHSLTSEPAVIEVSVKEQISQKHCRKGVELLNYKRFGNGKVCGLHDKFLSFAKYGTPITLIGEKSLFGFTVKSYRYQEPLQNTFLQTNSTKISSDLTHLLRHEQDLTIIEHNTTINTLELKERSQTLIRDNTKVTTMTVTDHAVLLLKDNPSIANIIASKNSHIHAQGGNISFIYLLEQNSLHISKLNISAGGYTSPTLNFSGGAIFFTTEAQISLTVQDYTFHEGVLQGHWGDATPFRFTLVTTDFFLDPSPNVQPLDTTNLMLTFLRMPLYKPNVLPKNINIKLQSQ